MRPNTEHPQPRAHELLRCLGAEQRQAVPAPDGPLRLLPQSTI